REHLRTLAHRRRCSRRTGSCGRFRRGPGFGLVSITTEPPRSGTATRHARPAKPPPNWFLWGGLVGVVLITWWSARQIGLTLRPLFTDDLTRGTAVMARFFDPNWGFIFE